MFVSDVKAPSSRSPTWWRSAGVARIANDVVGNEPIPYQQNDYRSDGCANQAGALVEPIPTDSLADEGRDKRARDAKHGGKDETLGIVRTRREDTRDEAGDRSRSG